MVHAKIQYHRTTDSEESRIKDFHHIWALWPSWSCDQDHFYKFMSPLPKDLALIGNWFQKKMFEITVLI